MTVAAIGGTNIIGIYKFNTNLDAIGGVGYMADDYLWREASVMLKYSTEGYSPFVQAAAGASDYYDLYYGAAVSDGRISVINRITNS